MSESLKKMKVCMYLEAALGFQNFIGVILTVFYLSYMGLSMSQYLFIEGLTFVLIAVFEIPSGYLSDKFGRKKMIVLSKGFELLAMAILVLCPNITGALCSACINGIFGAMESGNADALYYEAFSKENKEAQLRKTMAQTSTISFISTMVCSVLAGLLAEKNLTYPVIADMVLLGSSIAVIVLFLEDKEEYRTDAHFSLVEDFNLSKKDFRYVVPQFVLLGILFGIHRVSYSAYQPLFTESGVPLAGFGILFATCNICSAFGSSLYAKIHWYEDHFFTAITLWMSLTVVGITCLSGWGIVAMILCQQMARGITMPYLRYRTQQVIPSDSTLRVTYGSIHSLLTKLISALFMFVYALFPFSKIQWNYGCTAFLMIACSIGLYTAIRKKQRKRPWFERIPMSYHGHFFHLTLTTSTEKYQINGRASKCSWRTVSGSDIFPACLPTYPQS